MPPPALPGGVHASTRTSGVHVTAEGQEGSPRALERWSGAGTEQTLPRTLQNLPQTAVALAPAAAGVQAGPLRGAGRTQRGAGFCSASSGRPPGSESHLP